MVKTRSQSGLRSFNDSSTSSTCGSHSSSTGDKVAIQRCVKRFCEKMDKRRHPPRKSVFAVELLKYVSKECPDAGVKKSDVDRWMTKSEWVWPFKKILDGGASKKDNRGDEDQRKEDEETSSSDSDGEDLFSAVSVDVNKNTGQQNGAAVPGICTSKSVHIDDTQSSDVVGDEKLFDTLIEVLEGRKKDGAGVSYEVQLRLEDGLVLTSTVSAGDLCKELKSKSLDFDYTYARIDGSSSMDCDKF